MREALSFEVVFAQFERSIHKLFEVHRLAYYLTHSERLAFVDKVPAPKLVWRHVERTRYPIHLALEREDALRRAEAAKRSMWRMIRSHSLAANADIRTDVWTTSMNRAARQHHS